MEEDASDLLGVGDGKREIQSFGSTKAYRRSMLSGRVTRGEKTRIIKWGIEMVLESFRNV